MHKHRWSWTVKYDPDHFGKDDMHPPQSSKPDRWINVGMLDALYRKLSSKGKVEDFEGKPVLNLTLLGIKKLLGGGSVKNAYLIVVDSFTEGAKKKVVDAGGMIKG
ncbi:MAG: uL15 family ribosomal protein [Nitrososphaeria archaeon]